MKAAAGLFVVLVCSSVFAGAPASRALTFEDRVKAQTAIERVYYLHQVGATKKFEDAVPKTVVQAKVQKYLEQSAALNVFWKTAITDQTLQRELERMAQGTRMPGRLQALYAALGSDPFLVKECLARPALVDRLTHNFQAFDSTLHVKEKAQADALHAQLQSGTLNPSADNPNRIVTDLVVSADDAGLAPLEQSPQQKLTPEEFKKRRAEFPTHAGQVSGVKETHEAFTMSIVLSETKTQLRIASYVVPKTTWDAWWAEAHLKVRGDSVVAVASGGDDLPAVQSEAAVCAADDTWDNGSFNNVEVGRLGHSAVWDGNAMLVWGGAQADYGVLNTGRRYDPATDTWTSITTVGAPSARTNHTAVWTGSAMVVWGGGDTAYVGDFNTGGRYDPIADAWTPISVVDAPTARYGHTAVWTGQAMIVWGGHVQQNDNNYLNTGGRYDPLNDAWAPTSIVGAPSGSEQATAVWTGHVMILWGSSSRGRYNPETDSWLPMSSTGAPVTILGHSAVWTGTEMVIWGGLTSVDFHWEPTNKGARYNPDSDTWITTSTDGAPSPRVNASIVWTGTRMLVWGGDLWSYYAPLGDGGVYNPGTDSWSPISPSGVPTARTHHSAIWTGSTMVVWGGDSYGPSNTGGRYDPASDTWTPTYTGEFVSGQTRATAVWTGNVAIIWGGSGYIGYLDTGERYDPVLDEWTSTSTVGVPTARMLHSAVWTGEEMIVWGGHLESGTAERTGGRYDPISDRWIPVSKSQAPIARAGHTAVWTGSRMLIWGGGNVDYLNSGGQYDPVTDTWAPISTAGAPVGRYFHSARWLEKRMVVWGGAVEYEHDTNSGGRYDPVTDLWSATSLIGAPPARESHSVVSTGSSMIIWGGYDWYHRTYLNSGARYDPVTDAWSPTSSLGAPTPRFGQTGIWTGAELVIWGGLGSNGQYFNTGARYSPTTDTWAPTSTIGAPVGRGGHIAVWTGSVMMVWGGSADGIVDSGGRYILGASVDNDHDGFTECQGDCDDANPLVNPGAHEICDGVDNDCDGVVDGDVEALCGDGNPCTDDACDPSAGCVHIDNVALCDDGNPCTSNDTCREGLCIGHSGCEDGLPCTDDRADPAKGCACSNPVSARGTACIDGDRCTLRTVCDGAGGGVKNCGGGTLLDCNDGNLCTDDACDPALGCVRTNNTNACDDGSVCTTADTCGGGSCHGGPPLDCDDGNVCTDDTCEDPTGCVHNNNFAACDDGDPCDGSDYCAYGTCRHSTPLPCDDHNPCTTDVCDPTTGCVFTNNPNACDDGNPCTDEVCDPSAGCIVGWNTGPCDDGNACTVGDQCVNGSCHGGPLEVCNDFNSCTTDACDPAAGCTWIPNTGPCDDGDACTVGDICGGTICHSGTARNCDDGNPCTDDSCSPRTGCVHANHVGTCDDGNACTTGDVCGGGRCLAGTGTLSCDDNNACTDDGCVPATGCAHSNNTAACSDGSVCTIGDICAAGSCRPGAAIVCNDGNVCTTDTCNPATGCVFSNNTDSCDDGNACTTKDACVPRPSLLFNENFDGVTPPALPAGWTSVVTGTGSAWATRSSNSDTVPNSVFGVDNDLVADEALESPAIPIASATAKLTFRNRWSFDAAEDCYDAGVLEIKIGTGSYADIVAAGGSFISGGYTGTVSAYFNNPLSHRAAWCNTSSGYPDYVTTAVNLPAAAAGQAIRLRWRLGSDTSAAAIGQDIDSIVISDPANVCTGGPARDCNDNNPCTDDSCNPAMGCVHTNNANTCDDGNVCTTGDTCSAGTCHAGTPTICTDNNACTTDTCTPATGCVYTNNTNSCSDGNACTAGDACSGGSCHAGAPVVCAPADACHSAGTCNPATGACSSINAPDGTPCSDNNLCTTGDACRAGVCTPTFNGLNHPRPKSAGYYEQLCDGNHGHGHATYHGEHLTDADALCVAGLTSTFNYLTTVDELCNVLDDDNDHGWHGGRHHGCNGNGPNGHDCDKAENELIATALNICRARVCLAQDLDSHCHGNNHTTVAQSFADGDAILDNGSRDQHTCSAARCELREINNGHALEMNSLVLSMESGKVRLTWELPVMDDGAGTPSDYELWRRPMGSGDDFTKIGQTTGLTFVDSASGAAVWEYDVSAVLP